MEEVKIYLDNHNWRCGHVVAMNMDDSFNKYVERADGIDVTNRNKRSIHFDIDRRRGQDKLQAFLTMCRQRNYQIYVLN